MAKSELKDIAKILYMQGWRQKEIAAKLAISENTVSRWAKTDHWDSLKKNTVNSRTERLSELYAELAEFNRMIKDKEDYKVASSKEADARRKLIADISALETKYNIADTMSVAKDFITFVSEIDYEFSRQALTYFDAFINQQIEKQKWGSEE